jgi:hypothetical protein
MAMYDVRRRSDGTVSGIAVFVGIPKGDSRGRSRDDLRVLHDTLLFEAGRIRGQLDRKGKAALHR